MFIFHFQGFSVEGQENIQEILSKQLYLCQMLVLLSVLREGHVIRIIIITFYQNLSVSINVNPLTEYILYNLIFIDATTFSVYFCSLYQGI